MNKGQLAQYSYHCDIPDYPMKLSFASNSINSSQFISACSEAKQIVYEAIINDPEARQIEPEATHIDPEAKHIDPEARQIDPEAKHIDPEATHIDLEATHIEHQKSAKGLQAPLDVD